MSNTKTFWGFRNIKLTGDFTTPPFVKRYEHNPVLSAKDIPYNSAMVFNCSVIKDRGRYTCVFRNDYYFDNRREGHPDDTNFGIAHSADGIHWKVADKPIFQFKTAEVARVYDPRIIPLGGRYYMTCCAQSKYGPRSTTFVTDDFTQFDLVDMAMPCSRNSLLFPEKIGGKYFRLERPFWGDAVDSYSNAFDNWIGQTFDTWITESPDLVHWGKAQRLIGVEQMPYANIKNGPGAVPIKTEKGWLLLIHGVDYDPARGKNGWEASWKHRYHAGVALVDLHNPTKLIGLGRTPLITPEADYETQNGFRNDVIFPMAGIVEDNGDVKIYYGAADTHVCLATANLSDLLDMCEPI